MKKNFFIMLSAMFLFCFAFSFCSFAADSEDSGGLIIFDKPVAGVVFDHQKHSDMDCSDCHDDIFPQSAGETAETKDFSMKAMEEGETCGACHDGESAFSVKKHCIKCHIGKMNVDKIEK